MARRRASAPPPPAPPASRYPLRDWLAWPSAHLVLLAAAVLLGYAHTLDVPFYLDDFSSIQENPRIYDWQGVAALWNYPYLNSPLRIVGYLSFAANYAWHQFHPAGYHVVNILVHLLAGVAVYGLARGLLRTPRLAEQATPLLRAWLPLLAALLFVLHPLHTQAVTYIVQRLASLAALFYLAALAAYLQARLAGPGRARWLWAGAALLCGVLGVFTKQNTAVLPVAMLLVEAVLFRAAPLRLLQGGAAAVGGLFLVWVVFAWAFGYSPLSLDALGALLRDKGVEYARGEYLATQLVALWLYSWRFLWPAGLHLDYAFPLLDFGHAVVWLALAGHLAVLGLAVRHARRWPLPAFVAGFYYLAHSVESSLIPIRDLVFEHRAYLPDAGLCLLAAWGLLGLGKKWPGPRPRLALIAVLLLLLGGLTWQRNQLWRDPVAFWRDNTEKAPAKERAWSNLGKHLLQSGQIQAGLDALQRATALQKQSSGKVNVADMVNLIIALKHLKRYAEALALSEEMLRRPDIAHDPALLPMRVKFMINQGNIYAEQGRTGDAEQVYRKALGIYPDSLLARANLANALAARGQWAEAESLYLEILAIEPGNPLYLQNLEQVRRLRAQTGK